MPSLSAAYNPALGPLIPIFITLPAVLHAASQIIATGGQQTNPVNVHAGNALIDTGASITCITPQLAQMVGLPLIGKRNMGTASGTAPSNVYLADLAIPFGAIPAASPGQTVQAQVNAVTLPSIAVVEFQCPSPHFNMLLGRDILCTGIFTLGFDGRFTFSI